MINNCLQAAANAFRNFLLYNQLRRGVDTCHQKLNNRSTGALNGWPVLYYMKTALTNGYLEMLSIWNKSLHYLESGQL
jgi:hypothetical protein